jgi:hypothetical protein
MTYYQKGWNLYVANILMKKTVKDVNRKVLSESYYIAVELFQFNDPEEAYSEISKLIEANMYSDEVREGDGIVAYESVRLDELDLLQTTMEGIKSQLMDKSVYSVNISIVKMNELENATSVKRKEELALFDKYYSYGK